MRTCHIILFFCIIKSCSLWGQNDSIINQRNEKETYLREHVLNKKENLGIQQLDFFDFSEDWIIQAKLVRNRGKRIKIPTSTERLANYRRFGYLCFEIKGQPMRLTVFQNLDIPRKQRKTFFVPFKDLTASKKTYGGGRYLDIPIQKNDSISLNFNDAYNPYCTYSHRYSCPLPPLENHLEVKIEAGEKIPIPQRTD
jgi:uncharacterized protein (DUF1684 family)